MPDQIHNNPSSNLFDQAINPELERNIYDQLHKIAHFQLLGHRQSTINTTMLVHEAYIKINPKNNDSLSKTHFFALSAHVMRQVVIDHARQKKSQKRGGLFIVKTYYDDEVFETNSDRLFQLDQALNRLEELDPDLVRLVELRFFSGFSLSDAAICLGLSRRTAARQWAKARTFLETQLGSLS